MKEVKKNEVVKKDVKMKKMKEKGVIKKMVKGNGVVKEKQVKRKLKPLPLGSCMPRRSEEMSSNLDLESAYLGLPC